MTIFLQDLVFHACHGLYPEEGKVGGRFVVNAEFDYDAGTNVITHIDHTINYVEAFRIIERRMLKPEALLETLAMEITYALIDHFPMSKRVKVKIEKSKPPIEGMEGSVAVAFESMNG